MEHQKPTEPMSAPTPFDGTTWAGDDRAARDTLLASIKMLEEAVDEARSKVQKPWQDFLLQFEQARNAFEEHVRSAEAPEGLLGAAADARHADVADLAERLRREHRELGERLQELQWGLSRCVGSGLADMNSLCRATRLLLSDLRQHQEKGQDLFYRAYQCETGAGD